MSIDGLGGLKELGSLYEYLQERIRELIETLDELWASPDYEFLEFAENEFETDLQSSSVCCVKVSHFPSRAPSLTRKRHQAPEYPRAA